jgi:hypothetical protein
VLGVLFIRWTRQGYRNADIVAPGVRRFGHGWAIGAWFTPFLAVWRPKQIVNDIYAAGHDPAGPPADPSGPEAVRPKPVWLSDAAPAAPFAEPERAAPEYSEPPVTGSVPPPGWAQSG